METKGKNSSTSDQRPGTSSVGTGAGSTAVVGTAATTVDLHLCSSAIRRSAADSLAIEACLPRLLEAFATATLSAFLRFRGFDLCEVAAGWHDDPAIGAAGLESAFRLQPFLLETIAAETISA